MKTLRISAGFAIGVALLHGCLIGAAQPAFSASILTLPDTSQTSTFQATIGEQINVVVPTIISFGNITIGGNNSSVAATSAAQTVSITGATLASGQTVKISLEANAANFTDGAGPTFAASDVSWNAATWTLATGALGTLKNTAFTQVAQSVVAPVGTIGTTNLVFTLGVHNFGAVAVQAGPQTLVATWQFQSF